MISAQSTTRMTAASKLRMWGWESLGVAQCDAKLDQASIVSTMPCTHLDVEDVRRSLDEVFDV